MKNERTSPTAPSKSPARKPRLTASARTARLTPDPVAPGTAAPTNDAIALRAYEIFCARQGADGDPLADWLQAEQELKVAT